MATQAVTVYLSLGSNMGDRRQNLDRALELLSERMRIEKVSPIYESEPMGDVNQPRYLNLVCQAHTTLTPQGLLALAKGIEIKLGRTGKSGAPRPIDIDILLYDEEVVQTPDLVIPHPHMTDRAFVLVPLADIAPGLVHPIKKRTVKKLLKAITEKQGVFKWESEDK